MYTAFNFNYGALESQLHRLKKDNNQKSLFLKHFPKPLINLEISGWGKVNCQTLSQVAPLCPTAF